jgi:ATP-binding cassette subfamily B (MDR/TAP) protein 1
VFAFCRYETRLVNAKDLGIRRALWSGIGAGIAWFMIFVSYALAFWYGPKLIIDSRGEENPTYNASILIIVSKLTYRHFM